MCWNSGEITRDWSIHTHTTAEGQAAVAHQTANRVVAQTREVNNSSDEAMESNTMPSNSGNPRVCVVRGYRRVSGCH